MAKQTQYPRIERGCLIEVASPRNGRPGYRWVQGWEVHYSATRRSIPMRRMDASNELQRALRDAS